MNREPSAVSLPKRVRVIRCTDCGEYISLDAQHRIEPCDCGSKAVTVSLVPVDWDPTAFDRRFLRQNHIADE